MHSEYKHRYLWWLLIAVMMAGLVPGMAQASPRSDANEWCRHYKAKYPGKPCHVVKRGRLCPKGTKKRATFGGVVRGYKICTRKGKSQLLRNRDNARRWCKKWVRNNPNGRCVVVKRGLPCAPGTKRHRTFGKLGNGYKACTGIRMAAYASKARQWCRAWLLRHPGTRCVVVKRGLPCAPGTKRSQVFGPLGKGFKACTGVRTSTYAKRAQMACKRYRMRTGNKCVVRKRGLPCPPGFARDKLFGGVGKGYKTCVSGREMRGRYKHRAAEWCKRFLRTNPKGRCVVMKRIGPCPLATRKGAVFGPPVKGYKTCYRKPGPGYRISALTWCKRFMQRTRRVCVIVPRTAPCPPPKVKAKTFGPVSTGFKVCAPPIASGRDNLRKARAYCKNYRIRTGKRCAVVKRGLPCGPGKKMVAVFGPVTTGFKACVKR